MNLRRRKSQTRKKLGAQRRRNARVYKGTAAASVTFCGKEERRRERSLIFVKIGASDTKRLLRSGRMSTDPFYNDKEPWRKAVPVFRQGSAVR